MSFYAAPYSQPYSSNRGMTMYPEQQYANNVAYYTPRPQQVGGGRQVNSDGSSNAQSGGGGGLDFSQFFQTNLNGGGGGAQQAAFDPRQLAGRDKLEYQRMMARGASPFRSRMGGAYTGQAPVWNQQGTATGGGTSYPTSGGIPNAGTQPQIPTGGGNGLTDLMNGIASVNSGITAGAMPAGALQQALASFQAMSGGQGGFLGGLMSQYGNRAGLDMERSMAQQQAQMGLTAQQAQSQGNLDKMNLLYNNQRENVLNDTAMRNALINLFSGMAGGVL